MSGYSRKDQRRIEGVIDQSNRRTTKPAYTQCHGY
ncbi:hypothetical protein ACFGVR_07780 [Mucilaginibacter sp. AW1-3]